MFVASDSTEFYENIRENAIIDLFILNKRIRNDERYNKIAAGLDTLTAIRRLYSMDIPAIITGVSELTQEDLSRANHLNACYLQKPFELDEFDELIHSLLDKHSHVVSSGTECYANVYFPEGTPEPLIAEETYSLFVKVTPLPTIALASEILSLPGLLNIELQVVVRAENMNVFLNTHPLIIDATRNSEPIEFSLMPQPSSVIEEDRKIHVCFFYGASLLKTISFDIKVFTPTREDEYLPSSGPINDPEGKFIIPFKRPPTAFSLTFLDNNNGIDGFFASGLTPSLTNIPIVDKNDWEELNKSLRNPLQILATDGFNQANDQGKPLSNDQIAIFLDPLVEAGERAFFILFPNQTTRETICQIVEDTITDFNGSPIIEITSDNYLIPWDLVQLCLSENLSKFDHSFENMWGMKSIVHKKCFANGPLIKNNSIIDNKGELVVGLPWNTSFDSVRQFEISHLRNHPNHISVLEIGNPKTIEEILELMKQKLHVLQFACHARVQTPLSESYFEFSDSAMLTLGKLQNPRITPDISLLILSSCESLHFDSRLKDSFIRTFFDKGVRGLLGTEVPVSAPFASRFLTDFYNRFLSGKSIGVSLLEARQRCWQNPSCRAPFGMIFSYYGDIDMRLQKPISELHDFPCEGMFCCL